MLGERLPDNLKMLQELSQVKGNSVSSMVTLAVPASNSCI